MIAQVLARSSTINSVNNINANDLHAGTRRSSRALHRTNHITDSSTSPVLQTNVTKVEFARVATSRCTVVGRTLRNCVDASIVVQDEVGEGDVGSITETTSAAVWRITSRVTSP
jgi:hypothetical protein